MVNMSEKIEPEYNGEIIGNIELIRLLNWYSANSSEDTLKEWSLAWASQFKPNLVSKIEKAPPYKFFTYGSLARLLFNGFPLEQSRENQLVEYFRSL